VWRLQEPTFRKNAANKYYRRLLVTANVVPSSMILVTLMMVEALGSYETSVLTRTTRRNNPEDGIFYIKFNSTNISQNTLRL
jgi:hypothetical protein